MSQAESGSVENGEQNLPDNVAEFAERNNADSVAILNPINDKYMVFFGEEINSNNLQTLNAAHIDGLDLVDLDEIEVGIYDAELTVQVFITA